MRLVFIGFVVVFAVVAIIGGIWQGMPVAVVLGVVLIAGVGVADYFMRRRGRR